VAQTILVARPIEVDPTTEVHVIDDWFEELERLVPTD
jgi:hypothetical protein